MRIFRQLVLLLSASTALTAHVYENSTKIPHADLYVCIKAQRTICLLNPLAAFQLITFYGVIPAAPSILPKVARAALTAAANVLAYFFHKNLQQPQQTAQEEQLSIAEQLQIYQLFEEAKRRSAAAMQPQNVPITSQQPSTIASPKKEYAPRKQQNQPTLGRQINNKRIEEQQRLQTERRLAAINKNITQAAEQIRIAHERERLRQEARKAEEKKHA